MKKRFYLKSIHGGKFYWLVDALGKQSRKLLNGSDSVHIVCETFNKLYEEKTAPVKETPLSHTQVTIKKELGRRN